MREKLALIFAISIMPFFVVTAQDAAEPTVTTVTDPEHGTYLADGAGRTLYLFTQDPSGESTCVDECALNWPPLVAEGELSAGAGVAQTLLGTVTRPDGVEQVTYSGLPLYYFAQDEAPGEVNGQGVNDVWFLVSPFGAAIEPPEPKVEEPVSAEEQLADAELAAVMETGSAIFSQHCSACHGARGGGGAGPALDGGRLDDNRRVIRQVLNGGSHMPGFRSVLDDEQIAAVVTYIRKSWSNDFPSVTPEEVMSFR